MSTKTIKKVLISLIMVITLSLFVVPLFTSYNEVFAAADTPTEQMSGGASVFLGALPGLIS